MNRHAVLWVSSLLLFVAGCATSGSGQDGNRKHLGDVWFPTGSDNIQRVDRTSLNLLAEELKTNPAATGYLTGHAYDYDGRGHNMSMGARRARAAEDYIVSLGVAPDRIRTTSRGESQPPVAGDNLGERKRNNRVGVYLVTPATAGP